MKPPRESLRTEPCRFEPDMIKPNDAAENAAEHGVIEMRPRTALAEPAMAAEVVAVAGTYLLIVAGLAYQIARAAGIAG